MRNKDSNALTDEEIAFLKSDGAPPVLKRFVSRKQERVGLQTSAYRKLAAAARAEREALVEVALLEVIRVRSGIVPEPDDPARTPMEIQATLELENQRLRQELAQRAITDGHVGD